MVREAIERVIDFTKENKINTEGMSEENKALLREKYEEFEADILEELVTKHNQLDSNEEYIIIKIDELEHFARESSYLIQEMNKEYDVSSSLSADVLAKLNPVYGDVKLFKQ